MREYENREWLDQKYTQERLSRSAIATLCGCCKTTVLSWMKRFDIPRRTATVAVALLGRRVTPETRLKMSQSHRGRRLSDEHKLKLSVAFRGRTILWKDKISRAHIGIRPNEETRKKLRQYANNRPAETIEKMRRARTGKTWEEIFGPEIAAKQKLITGAACRKRWQDPAYVKRVLLRLNSRPSRPESIVATWFPELNYTGNGTWWRTLPNGKHKNPDFKVAGQDKVIEIFGDYWHRNDDPQHLVDLYQQAGLACLVIWENEIHNQAPAVADRVRAFLSA